MGGGVLLEGLPYADLGAGAIVVIFVLLLATGRIVPRRTLEDVRTDRDTRVREIAKERDDWKTAFHLSEESRRLLAESVDDLLEQSRTHTALLTALPRPRNADG